MSELRNSTPPVPPMSGDVERGIVGDDGQVHDPSAYREVKPPKARAKRARAAKAPKSAGSSKAVVKQTPVLNSPTARTNKSGAMLACQVVKCQNPARWPHGGRFTCTTHHKAIERGKRLDLTGPATRVWNAPVSSKAQAAAKPKAAAKSA